MKLLLFPIFIFFLLFVSPSISCDPNDKKALLQIKKSLNNPQILYSWDPKTDCCTNWTGVECTRRRVTSLLIQAGEVSGEIAPEVGHLPFLRYLDFNNLDDLTGSIPSTIAKLKFLDTLRLRGTKLSGSVPDFIGELKELTVLDLSFNQFTGSIPGSLSKLPKLEVVELNENQLTGSVPESFGFFEGTVPDLYLGFNQLSGNIPASWSKSDFNTVFLERNHFSGDASMIFGANKTTVRVDLSKNNFSFDLSKVKFPMSLTHLDLSYNRIYGTLPTELSGLALEHFDISNNRLCGRIPQGGVLQNFDANAFSNNRCLCGAPLKDC